ncbi:MAG: iron-containing redox enzyme family protein [Myxococcota bacterium]|nr:iron-containing redox enzyme family protein [Myxococcota bacterium]
MQSFIDTLEKEIEQCWEKIYEGSFWRHLRTHGLDRELYICMMTQIYGYTKYNSQSQALAATKVTSERLQLLRFCLEHAFEEAGHDLMVLNDLENIGVDRETIRNARMLPTTKAFVAYLFHISTEYDATARLGYSFWAEGSYSYIEELTNAMRQDLNLPNKYMTFFMAHSEIDKKHLDDVTKVLSDWCINPQQQQDTIEVLKNTLHLTGSILDEVYEQYIENRRMHNLLQTA